ncbi:MAG: ATP-binding protein, partial [Sedimentisphaerales bacterium]|nr:ATP-binding protein [Sedimentisphaerales bacterium]
DNAIAFAPQGSSLLINISEENGMLNISVIDEGPGIPAYAMPRIFDRFYSLTRPGAPKSTGLGLPFVREVALLHGGGVTVTNRRDRGTGVCACLSLLI